MGPGFVAHETHWLVHAQPGSAVRAGPTRGLLVQEAAHSPGADGLKIGDGAGAITGSVPLVEVAQRFAGQGRAPGAGRGSISIPKIRLTVLDLASEARLGLASVIGPAAGTGIAGPEVCPANGAVQSARGDQHLQLPDAA